MDRRIEKKPFYLRPRSWMYAAGGALFLVLIILILSDTGSKLNVDADKITISTVREGDFQEFIPVTGTVMPKTSYYLDAIQGGIVEKKFVDEGAMLKKGDKILQLSNSNVQLSALQQETATYEQINLARNTHLQIQENSVLVQNTLVNAVYQLKNNKELFEREKRLYEKKLDSQQNYEQAYNNYHQALEQERLARMNFEQDSLLGVSQLSQINSSIARMEKNLRLIREMIDNLTVKAPISGQLTSLNAEIGQSKNPGDQLGVIDALDGFKVRADIDEFYIARVIKGLHATVTVNDSDYKLIVTKVYPEVTGGKFQVDMNFSGQVPDGIRRGQTLQIRLQLSERTKALLLARGGFYQTTGGQWVFLLNSSGNLAVRRNISLGRQNPDYFEVLSGLKPGDRVVTSSYDNFGNVQELVVNR
ncbi:MAG: HlyD family efflux transporter periplasmic adaptor subunit [Bacteroidetes bacterium]|nr:HlyD family efflux transporter periplasmic adaptor subunit [Bacteroidota bacterium]